MAIETKERDINGASYKVTTFPGRTGARMTFKLAKLLGPGLGSALEAGESAGGLMQAELGSKSVGALLAAFTERLDPDRDTELLLSLFSMTWRNGRELTAAEFDSAFAGNFGEMIQALGFVFEVNFSSFMGAVRTITSLTAAQEAPLKN
jgi:hypothetical protein